MDRIEGLLDGDASHAPEKGIEVQEIEDPAKNAPFVKEMPVSSEGMFPLDCLKELLKELSKISMKSPPSLLICTLSHTLLGLITLKCLLVINLPNFNNLREKEI